MEDDKRTRTVVINDAAPPPGESYLPTASLLLVSADPTPESAGSVDFAVVLDRVWGKDARFEVELDAHDNLTATPAFSRLGQAGDFEAPNGLIHATIPAGQTRFEFSLTLYDDDVREDDETFQMLLTSPYDDSLRTIDTSNNKALVTIADDDRIPPTEVVLSLSRHGRVLTSVDEGSSRWDITVTASFPRIHWPGDATNAPLRPADPRDVDTTVRVQFDPNSGATHAAGLDDFAPLKVEDDQGAFQEVESFDIVIPAGQTSGTATLRFKTVKDDVDEEDETVTLLGSELVAGDPADSLPVRSASFTIIDDDTTGITISPAKLAAGTGISMKEGGTSTYSLVLDSEPTDTVTVTVAGRQGDLISLTPETLTFTPSDWSTAKTISVVSLDDGTDTSFTNAVISHQVSGGDYGSVTVREIWVQIENTTQAYIYLDDAQASESDGHLEFTVSVRPILRTVPVVVRYATVDGTAVAGTDYTREVTTDQTYNIFSIPANGGAATIRIPITDNEVYGPAKKTFTLHLTNQNNKATLDGGATSLTATGAIADDDPKPVVSVAGPAGEVSYVSENAKDPVTFTLTLVGQSAGDVTVNYATGEAGLVDLLTARQGLTGATEDEDYAGISGTFTFTSGQTTKTVTVQVTNDDVSEETEFFGFRISAPQGADLKGQRSEDVADVGLLDDDPRGVAIDPISISLDEPASGETAVAGAYTVHLNSRPTDTVTVTIGGSAPAVSLSGGTLTNNQLTFTTTNWNTAQTITVTPIKDDNASGETITLTHTLSGGDYAGIAADSVTVNLTDSDARNVVLSEESLAVIEEDATGVRYTVKLATQPSDTVTVTISGHEGADLTLSGTTLTFTVDNWDVAQTVTVNAGQDEDAANDTGTLTHTASGGDYVNVTKDLPVTVTDDDTADIVLSKTDLSLTEGDAAGMSYTVALATKPSAGVSVSITGHSGTDLSLDKTTLTFTVDNWDAAQTVTVTAAEDDDGVVDPVATLTHTASGGDYANLTRDLTVTVTENDTPDIVISRDSLTVVEGDAAGMSYTVALATQPSDTVIVTISGHEGADLTLGGTTLTNNQLTFTVDNWDAAQTVTVKAGQDNDGAKDTATLTHTASGGDYAGITIDLPVSITDDDTPAIVLSKTDLSLTEGDAAGMSYTVKLATQPSDTVIVTISGHEGADLTLDGTTLTFTVGNWNTAQTVTVEAGQDADGANDTGTLTHTASGGGYAGITIDLPVTVTDDDQAGIVLSGRDLTVTEGDAGGSSYTVRLATRPSETVTVTISGHDGTDLTLSGTTLTSNQLTFTTTNWGTAQTVTVKAADDDNADNESETLTHTASGGDYVNITKDLPVAVTDDAPAGVSVSFGQAAYRVIEGAGVSVTVSLNEDPERTVVIPLVVTNQGGASDSDHSGVPERVTFNSGDTSTSFTLTAADDNLNETGESVRIAFGALPSTPIPVTAGSPDETTVTISGRSGQDVNTPPTVHFASAAYSVDEGNTVAVTVELSKAPGSDAVIPLTTTEQGEATFEDYSGVPVELTFEAADTQRTFTFAANQDTEDDDGESVLLGFSALPGGITATTGEASQATVAITDDDDPQVTVMFGADAYTVPEGGTQSVRVTLSADPERTVVIPLTATDQGTATPADYIVPTSVTFNSGDREQTITFTATQDAENDDGESVLLGFGPSLPTGVSLGTNGQATVSIDDDDEAGIVLSEAALSLEEGDAGGSSYTVRLATEPTGEVTVTVSGHAGTDLSLSGTTLSSDVLTFTVGNWNTAQTVTVRAGQDADGANDTGTLTHTALGGGYASVTKDLPVTVTDDDQAGIVLSKTDLSVTEGDAGGSSYTVALATRPSETVTVTISGHEGADLTLSGTTLTSNQLTFTTTNWGTAQTVTVKAADDDNADNESETLTHTASGGDYVNITKDLPVSITDDGDVQVTVMFGADAYTVPEGGTQSVTVTLSPDPERTVEIPLTATDQGTATPADYIVPTSVTFNSGDREQTITFTATQDAENDDGESVLLGFGPSLPTGVSLGTNGQATVSIDDDDEAGIVLSEAALSLEEGDATGASYTVKLATQPSGTVSVAIAGHAGTDLSLSGTTLSSDVLTFTVGNWNTAQTVTVEAGQDADGANDTGTLTHTASGGGYASVTKDLPVSITDDDQAGVAVSFDRASYRVLEGDAVTVGVTLSGDPKRTVVIHLVAIEEGGASSEDYSGVPSSVTINEGETSTSFNFMATQDDVDEICECVLLTFGALPSGVSAGPTDEAKVSIIDNATPNGPPTVPPGPFGLTAYGEDQALSVRWETPAAEDQRAPVTSYRMRYRQVGASSWRNVSHGNDGLTLWEDITGLTNRRAYEVQVAAVSRMGPGAWASVKGTPQAPNALPPGPEGNAAFGVGRLRIYWLDPIADHTNVLQRESCTGSEGFRAFWTGPDDNRRADEWAVHINTRGGAGEVSYSFDESSGPPDRTYFSMNGTVNFEGAGALSLSVRGRFGSTWGTWWSPPVSLYCHEPEAPADTCSLQVQQQAVENTSAEGGPRIDGIPELGQTLSVDTTAIADVDGLEEVVFQYQWLAEDAYIPGATGSTYTVVFEDVGKAISVRVSFTDDGDNEETLTSAPTVVTAAGLQLRSATVDGVTLTLTYSEELDNGGSLPQPAFAVNVNGSSRSLSGVAVGQSDVLLLLSSAVEAGDTVTVDYTVPDGPDFIRDTLGRKAASFSRQAVTNAAATAQDNTALASEDTAPDPLTASVSGEPSSHDGQTAFTFELRFSGDPKPNFSYTTVRDHAFTVAGGSVTYVRRLAPPSNIGWEVHVTPDGNGDVNLSLRSTTDCSAQGAICTGDGGKLSGRLQLAVAGPNTPATGLPTIAGTAQVGETLTADATGISDGDGLDNAAFAYQWLGDFRHRRRFHLTLADHDGLHQPHSTYHPAADAKPRPPGCPPSPGRPRWVRPSPPTPRGQGHQGERVLHRRRGQ